MKKYSFLFIIIISAGLNAQDCNEGLHSNHPNDAWISCESSENPNPLRGESIWIMYDLGYTYFLGTTHFWNYNEEWATEFGMKDIIIDVSLDGNQWKQVATFTLDEATGTNTYDGQEGPNLNSEAARYILLNATENWNNEGCGGLSEVRFDITDSQTMVSIDPKSEEIRIFPNPVETTLHIASSEVVKELVIINTCGHEMLRRKECSHVDLSFLPNGIYILGLRKIDGHWVKQKIIKVN